MPSPPEPHAHIVASPGSQGALLPERQPGSCTLVLFGITGDLVSKKILPALYHLSGSKALPQRFAVAGFSRSAESDDSLRERLRADLEAHLGKPPDEDLWLDFAGRCYAVSGSAREPRDLQRLAERLDEIGRAHGTGRNHLFYFATPPSTFPSLLRGLHDAGLLARSSGAPEAPWARVVIEKPFGHDYDSARALNQLALELLDEQQVYRIDHYLGKETVQNILVLRFANSIFEPLWSRGHVDHVQITLAESIGVEGRGAFYEETGVLRDIVQNHLLQTLALCTMEPPVSFHAEEIRNMKAQVLRSLRPLEPGAVESDVVRGQYEGYRGEEGVARDSSTPTFVALRAHIDNWRWQGVPFYLRAGKGLAARMTEIAFTFRTIPFCLFGEEATCSRIEPNVLRIRIQPDEGVALQIASKVPGEDLRVGTVGMDFQYAEAFEREPPQAYERLLLDCMRGDQTLFARRDEVELSWRWIDRMQKVWEAGGGAGLEIYERGSQGPPAAAELLRREGGRWLPIA